MMLREVHIMEFKGNINMTESFADKHMIRKDGKALLEKKHLRIYATSDGYMCTDNTEGRDIAILKESELGYDKFVESVVNLVNS